MMVTVIITIKLFHLFISSLCAAVFLDSVNLSETLPVSLDFFFSFAFSVSVYFSSFYFNPYRSLHRKPFECVILSQAQGVLSSKKSSCDERTGRNGFQISLVLLESHTVRGTTETGDFCFVTFFTCF